MKPDVGTLAGITPKVTSKIFLLCCFSPDHSITDFTVRILHFLLWFSVHKLLWFCNRNILLNSCQNNAADRVCGTKEWEMTIPWVEFHTVPLWDKHLCMVCICALATWEAWCIKWAALATSVFPASSAYGVEGVFCNQAQFCPFILVVV